MLYAVPVPILDQLAQFDPATDLGAYVSNIVGTAFIMAALAAFLWLTWGGIEWILAGGDKAKVENARNRITNAIIGLAIVAAAWAIFLLLDYFFGIGIANKKGAPLSITAPASTYTSCHGWQFHCFAGANRGDPPDASCISKCNQVGGQIIQTDAGPGCWCPE